MLVGVIVACVVSGYDVLCLCAIRGCCVVVVFWGETKVCHHWTVVGWLASENKHGGGQARQHGTHPGDDLEQ